MEKIEVIELAIDYIKEIQNEMKKQSRLNATPLTNTNKLTTIATANNNPEYQEVYLKGLNDGINAMLKYFASISNIESLICSSIYKDANLLKEKILEPSIYSYQI
jgi:hypothetical protein